MTCGKVLQPVSESDVSKAIEGAGLEASEVYIGIGPMC